MNLVLYHGVLAPHARWRSQVVGYGRTVAGDSDAGQGEAGPRDAGGQRPPRYWAALMHRAFALDVLACPRCGGRLRLIATVDNPHVIREILAHLELPTAVPHPDPPRPPPAEPPRLFADVLA